MAPPAWRHLIFARIVVVIHRYYTATYTLCNSPTDPTFTNQQKNTTTTCNACLLHAGHHIHTSTCSPLTVAERTIKENNTTYESQAHHGHKAEGRRHPCHHQHRPDRRAFVIRNTCLPLAFLPRPRPEPRPGPPDVAVPQRGRSLAPLLFDPSASSADTGAVLGGQEKVGERATRRRRYQHRHEHRAQCPDNARGHLRGNQHAKLTGRSHRRVESDVSEAAGHDAVRPQLRLDVSCYF